MSTPTDPLDALIAAYVQAIEAGQVPDRRELFDQNPEHAQALQDFFADFDRIDRVASPLRLAGELDETAALNANGPTQLPTVRYFGDYELLEEVARGGMGVVYKARQASLNRIVALKMILAGTFATPREVARFQAEAEAAANLDHPHIVPVYEVGEHEGQQYFSMKFIEGGSLSSQARGEVKTEVRRLITIANAVHHAHQHGVLHRDLKPSNVLVDPKGDRHVTDFGLAKRLTDLDRSLTEAGQILGTPRYMSPEQAMGRKDLTVAADIYALGVILYERLTGRTPFEGETALALLRQVRETEPPRPSTIRPGLDRDLETIVLKCLEKDPTRRYPTAEELVEDLTRWLDGRPIAARPVGQTERFVRWCRRNPVVAVLSASVVLALLLGVVVSSLFAYQERKARIRAELAEGEALIAKDKTERTLARSLARPLDLNGKTQGFSLSDPEVEALWDLASQDRDSFKLRFLDEAIGDPLTLRQLLSRSEPALIATIGLDPGLRGRASKLLLERLKNSELPPASRGAMASLLWEIDTQPGTTSPDVSEAIIAAASLELPQDLRNHWDWLICDSISHEPKLASILLIDAIRRQSVNPVSLLSHNLVLALAEVSTRLEPAESARICGKAARILVDAVENTPNPRKWETDRAENLALLLPKLNPAESRRLSAVVASGLLETVPYRTFNTAHDTGDVGRISPSGSTMPRMSDSASRAARRIGFRGNSRPTRGD